MDILITNSSPIWGGNENWAVTAARLLRDSGHRVKMILLRDSPVADRAVALKLAVITVSRFGGDLELPALLRLYRIFSRQRPDAVILTKTKDYWVGGLTSWLAGVPLRLLRLSIVRRVKDNIKYRLIYRKFVNGVIVNSRDVEQAIRGSAEWAAQIPIQVLYNGIADPGTDVSTLEHCQEQAKEFRHRWNIPPGAFVCGACVNITRRKRLDLTISALADLKDRLPDARLVIAGDGEARGELEALAHGLGIGHRVHFPGRFRDVTFLYHLFDLYIIASLQEGMPHAGMEAMAHGCPVLSTDCGGIRELLDNGRCGLIVPADDPTALRQGILQLATNAPLRARFARLGRERFQACFTDDKMAANLEALLQGKSQPYPLGLLAERPGPRD